jgi:hypothetical protein
MDNLGIGKLHMRINVQVWCRILEPILKQNKKKMTWERGGESLTEAGKLHR